MRCEVCGTPLDRPGQAHRCRTDQAAPGPSADTFSLASRRVIRFGLVYAVVVAIASALGLAGYAAVDSGATDPVKAGTQASVLIVGTVVGLVGLACVIGLLISTVVWIVSGHRMTAAGPGLAGYGGLALCLLLIALAYVVPPQLPTVGDAVATDAALRIGGVVLLTTGVLLARTRISRQTGQRTPVGRPAMVTGDDWDASTWDPEVQRDIERRRTPNG